jgi:CheY-like chemotaxis protein
MLPKPAIIRDNPIVLISDDDVMMIQVLSDQATQAGLWVVPDAASNVEALAAEIQPAVIILDVNQVVDGRELLARLKQNPRTRDLQVIMLSGAQDAAVHQSCMKLGAAAFVVKPVEEDFVSLLTYLAEKASRLRLNSPETR